MGAIPVVMRVEREISEFPLIRNLKPMLYGSMVRLMGALETRFNLPDESYNIEARAHWNIGDQGQRWDVTVTFQSMEGSRRGWKAITNY